MPSFDPMKYAYPSRRSVVYARYAMACSSVPLSAQLGLDVMRRGGNAVDAAVAMAAALPLLEPTSNGLGGDCFALVWIEKDRRLYGLNASGVAPTALSAEGLRAQGYEAVPADGWLPTMVPGAPAGWAALNRRFGTRSLGVLFAPACRYAREGCPVPATVGQAWEYGARRVARAAEQDPAPYIGWWEAFAKSDGSSYRAGELFRWPAYADTLEALAGSGCESLYRGALMEKLLSFSRETGGYFCEDDFRNYRPLWTEPITADYKGYTVCEMPPNGHGITALMALNLLRGLELPQERESEEGYHRQIECVKLAFADAKAFVADPRYMKTSVEALLSEDYAARRRALIGERALLPEAGDPSCGGTVYFCTADPFGNMVSFIQSNYMGFGSGIVIPGTGISLQNRGANFSLDPASDNCLMGGKRSYHTIIPGFLMKDGEAVGPFGVMGGFMQPQGHLQVVVNTVDYHMNPQECLDAPRFQWLGEKRVELEPEIGPEIAAALAARGHEIETVRSRGSVGRGQIIWRTENGLLAGGTEPRCDGCAAAW